MDRDTWLRYYDESPFSVQTYLLNPKSRDAEIAAQTKLAYDHDAWDRVMGCVWELLFEKLNQNEWRTRLSAVKGDRTADEVERALLLHVVLPLADLVAWDVESRLQELGVKASEIMQIPRISLRPVSYGAAVRRICSNAKLSVLSEELVGRLKEALVSYLKGARTIEQLTEVLQRQQSENGMGFSKDQAAQFIKAMEDFLDATQVMDEQEYSDWFTRYQREADQKRLETDQAKNPPPPTEKDENAVPKIRASINGSAALLEGVDGVLNQVQDLKLDEYLLRRLENLISTRLRDVRNAIQVKEMLLRDTKVGGLGFSQADTDRVANIIENAYTNQRSHIEVEERERIQTVVADQQKKIEERKKRESEEHARWFEEKVKIARPEEVLRAQYQQAQAQSNAFAAAGATNQAPAKPRLDAVTPPLRLMGVEDELGTMTWASFRLLAKNPEDAAEKINQRLETLKAESFERWTSGLEAWRQSPLQQSYLKLVTESFGSGKPVAQLAEEKRTTNPDLPSSEELGAVVALNARLQS